jgi:predicted metal-dependent hydrolase|tara:strand:+ start:901 stop:1611 length:711 start_codon:yes stop_codon:yes gene_type:complete
MLPSTAEKMVINGFVATIKRTRRKNSVGFRMSLGQLVMLVPKAMLRSEIRRLLESKSDWILAKMSLYGQPTPPIQRLYVSGECLAFLDQELVLKVYLGPYGAQLNSLNELALSVPQTKPVWVRNALVRWYKLQAQVHIEQRISHFAPLVGAWPNAVEVKTYRARWGSCNNRGHVQFNWKLMMAPRAVVDSVVVHELCHLLHMHHGPEFWALVKQVLPHYKDAKQWLKEEGHSLGLD